MMSKFVAATRLLNIGSKKLLSAVNRYCSTKTPSQFSGEGFRWDVNLSDAKSLAQVADFVDANVYFTHEELPWHLRFTADYEKSVRVNKERESKDVFYYWPEFCMFNMDHDVITHLESEFVKWDVTAGMSEKALDWLTGISRVYAAFPEIPWDRLSFAHKHVAEAFIVDDCFEQSCRTGSAASFGSAYLANCSMIILDRYGIIDLRDFESDRVTRKLIEESLFAQEVLSTTTELARRALTPQQFQHFQGSNLIFYEYLMRESGDYYKHVRDKTFIDYEELLETRVVTSGFEIALSAVLPQHGSVDGLIGLFNPFVTTCSTIASIDNDIASAAKEKGTADGKDFCPISFYHSITKEHDNEMDSVRETLLRRNAMLRLVEQQVNMLPGSWRKSYENTMKLCCSLCDHGFLLGHGRPNPRYGYTWRSY